MRFAYLWLPPYLADNQSFTEQNFENIILLNFNTSLNNTKKISNSISKNFFLQIFS